MLLHFALVLHFAAIVITFCVSITFCGVTFIAFLNELLTYGKPVLVYKIAELPRSYSVNQKLSTINGDI